MSCRLINILILVSLWSLNLLATLGILEDDKKNPVHLFIENRNGELNFILLKSKPFSGQEMYKFGSYASPILKSEASYNAEQKTYTVRVNARQMMIPLFEERYELFLKGKETLSLSIFQVKRRDIYKRPEEGPILSINIQMPTQENQAFLIHKSPYAKMPDFPYSDGSFSLLWREKD